MVDRHELARRVCRGVGAGGAVRSGDMAHEDVAGVAVGVEEADVEDTDAVHVGCGKATRAHVVHVALVLHVRLQARQLWR
eukprot:365442-Chlamydomonas_euryale.AAC.18